MLETLLLFAQNNKCSQELRFVHTFPRVLSEFNDNSIPARRHVLLISDRQSEQQANHMKLWGIIIMDDLRLMTRLRFVFAGRSEDQTRHQATSTILRRCDSGRFLRR